MIPTDTETNSEPDRGVDWGRAVAMAVAAVLAVLAVLQGFIWAFEKFNPRDVGTLTGVVAFLGISYGLYTEARKGR